MSIPQEHVQQKRRFTARKLSYWAWSALLFLLGTLLTRYFENLPALEDVRNWGYQQQMKLSQHGPAYPLKTAVVEIGDHDFWGPDFVGREPLRADRLADIVDRLREAGVNTVVLDVDLRSPLGIAGGNFPEYEKEDRLLLASVGRMCDAGRNIVLGASLISDAAAYDLAPSALTIDPGRYSCVHWGYIQLPTDQRRVPGRLTLRDGSTMDSLALATLTLVDPTAVNLVTQNTEHDFRYGRFLTESDYGPRDGKTFSYGWSRLKGADINEVRRDLADRVVIVGGHWSRYAKGQGDPVDQVDTPAGPMSGVFLHANYIEAMYDKHGSFAPISTRTAIIIDFVLTLGMTVLGALEIHVGWKWGAVLINALILTGIAYLLVEIPGIYIDPVVGLMVLAIFVFIDVTVHVYKKDAHKTPKPAE